MRDFIRFLNAYKHGLLFLLLQVISFSLLFEFGVFQRTVFLSSLNRVTSSIQAQTASWTDYFHLDEVNDQLRAENLDLLQRCELSLKDAGKEYVFAEPDAFYLKRYQFQYSHVLNSTKHLQNNYLTLDKGRAQGIMPSMGVISEMSLVGRVERATKEFALVVPIIHRGFEASAQLERSGHFGLLSWNGLDYRFAQLGQIPKEAKVQVGDRVVTRGAGSLFPEGILIGTISEAVIEEGANFYTLQVELAVDFSSIQDVMLVKDEQRVQLDSLTVDMPTDE